MLTSIVRSFAPFLLTISASAQWTWIGGSDLSNGAAVYGTPGVFDPSVTPGAIYAPGQCIDQDGRLWVFGGTLGGFSNDLWCFDPAIEQWAWMGGGQNIDVAGHYGTKGVSSPANRPHSRGYCAAMWCDLDGDLWMFGGLHANEYNDLWHYEIASGLWTWMHGDSTTLSNGSYGIIGVADYTNEPPCRSETIGTWVADDGSLWMYGGERFPFYTYSDMWRYDPSTDQWTWMQGVSGAPGGAVNFGTLNVSAPTNTPGKRCAWTHWKDSDGKFWLFGGMTHGVNLPSNDLWMFDPVTVQWTWKGGPTGLADAGYFGIQGVPGGGAVPPALLEATANWKDSSGHFYFYGGGYREGTTATMEYEDVWRYDPLTGEWTWMWGSGLPDILPDHGVLDVPAVTNTPGGRMGASAVAVGDSLVYVFGGFAPQIFNDLWRLDMTDLDFSTGVSDALAVAPHAWYDASTGLLHVQPVEAQRAEIYDPTGRICMSMPVRSTAYDAAVIDVSGLHPGSYVLRLLDATRSGRAPTIHFIKP